MVAKTGGSSSSPFSEITDKKQRSKILFFFFLFYSEPGWTQSLHAAIIWIERAREVEREKQGSLKDASRMQQDDDGMHRRARHKTYTYWRWQLVLGGWWQGKGKVGQSEFLVLLSQGYSQMGFFFSFLFAFETLQLYLYIYIFQYIKKHLLYEPNGILVCFLIIVIWGFKCRVKAILFPHKSLEEKSHQNPCHGDKTLGGGGKNCILVSTQNTLNQSEKNDSQSVQTTRVTLWTCDSFNSLCRVTGSVVIYQCAGYEKCQAFCFALQ